MSALESVVSKGGKVAEKLISNLIELLMNQLLILDEIKIDGDVNLQKKKQVITCFCDTFFIYFSCF